MNLQCYCFHKSGSMFLLRLFSYIAENNNIDFYTTPGLSSNKLKSNKLWNNKLTNCINCPIRDPPINFDENLKNIWNGSRCFDMGSYQSRTNP